MEADDDETEGADAEGADAEDQEGAEGESAGRDYEAEKIIDCTVHSDESVEYLIKFKGYAEEEWVAAADAVGCKKLIRQYEAVQALKELGTGMITSNKMVITELCAFSCKSFLFSRIELINYSYELINSLIYTCIYFITKTKK